MSDFKDDYLEDDASQEEPIITYPISCTNVPDSLFDDGGVAASAHFEKFGNIVKILLRPLKKSCIIEFEKRDSAERAILNGGAYDGFMFNVTWSKDRKRPKVDNDPEWLPDPEVEAELKAMSRNEPSVQRVMRQKKMDLDITTPSSGSKFRITQPGPPAVRKSLKPIVKPKQPEFPKAPVFAAPLQPFDKEELRLLISRPWPTPSDKLKALEIRDKIIRSRLSMRKGAIQGCCPDMCSERERLLRDTQRQISQYEFDDEGGNLDPKKAIKQYSRSSADQEEPLSHELRPIPVLQDTLLYLLNHIVDSCHDETSLGDWFHFMWDRLRAIRKDITQQNLTCKGSVALVESCARFHAHCAARLVEEPPSSFDQRLNTENLSKCLQSLKYMYEDLRAKGQVDACKREPEFRAYVILLNMHDANFMWEVQRLDPLVLTSPEVKFAIKIFTALDNNHYIQFFKLVKETSYLNACILLRYFNNVRARALHRIVKTYSHGGTSQFPAQELMEMLGFESLSSMEIFLENYGLQVTSDQHSSYVLLNKNTFHDNDTPSIQERAVNLIESKLNTSLGDVIFGGVLPESNFQNYEPHSSFNSQGYFNKSAILAQDQGYEPKKETIDEVLGIVSNLSFSKKAESHNFESNFAANDKKPSFVFTKSEVPKELSQNVFNKPVNSIFKIPQDAGNRGEIKSVFQKPFVPSEPDHAQTAESIFSKGLNEVRPIIPTVFNVPPPKLNIFHIPKTANPFGGSTIFAASTTSSIFVKPTVSPSDVFKTALTTTTPAPSGNAALPSVLFGNAVAQQIISQKEKEEEEKYKAEEEEKRRRNEEEMRRREKEARRKKEEEERRIQEKIQEELRKQEELKRKLEEQKRILEEAKRKEEEEKRAAELARQKIEFEKKERERKQKELEIRIEEQVKLLVPELIEDVVQEQCKKFSRDALNWLDELHECSDKIAEELISDICKSESLIGSKNAVRLREIRLKIICRSVVKTWRHHIGRSRLRRLLLHTTPTWLPTRPLPRAELAQANILQKMRDFHQRKLPVLRVPEPRKQETINLFNTVRKSLFKQSQEINKNNRSLAVYWKVVTSIPDSKESAKSSAFLTQFMDQVFCDEQIENKPEHVVYLSENFKFSNFVITVCNIRGESEQQPFFKEKINGWNGVLFYGETQHLQNLTKRIENLITSKCPYERIPIAIVVVTNSKASALVALENTLELYKESRAIHHYKIFQVIQMNENLLCSASKAAFNWLAKHLPSTPGIKGDNLATFLDICLGSELWCRFLQAQKSSVRRAFENVETVTHLFNEAIERTINIACNKSLVNYPTFADEFKKFVQGNDIYPKDYQYLSSNWKNNLRAIERVLNSFKIKSYFTDVWPPEDFETFRETLTKYINKLDWFRKPENIILNILSKVKDKIDDASLWLEVMAHLVKYKINETISLLNENKSEYKRDSNSNDFIVVYQIDDLYQYRFEPWWYSSKYTQSICPELIDLPDDDSDLEIDHYISFKKMKLNENIDDSRILDDIWLNNVLLDIDSSMNDMVGCKNSLFELDKTLEMEKHNQNELNRMIENALHDG